MRENMQAKNRFEDFIFQISLTVRYNLNEALLAFVLKDVTIRMGWGPILWHNYEFKLIGC